MPRALLRIDAGLAALLIAAAAIGAFPPVASAIHCPAGQAHDADDNCSVLAGASTSTLAASTTLSQQGIFGCLGQGARVANVGQQALQAPSNVGTTRAIGGVYVPVNDAAVTLNTGFLVYKECILDGMARNIAQNVSAEYTKQQMESFNTGRNGSAQHLQNFDTLLTPYGNQITVLAVQAAQQGPMCGAFKARIPTAVARARLASVSGNASAYACTFASDANRTAVLDGDVPVDWNSWVNLVAGDYEVARYHQLQADTNARIARFNDNMRDMIMMGRGVIPIFDDNPNPLAMNVVTPGFIIADAISQATGSGFRQLEHANEIDQIVSNLFGGLTTRLLSSGSGIPGLFVTTGTQPAYIDRMVAQTQAAVRQGAINAAVNILAAARQTETAYLEAKQGIATALINAITQLRSYESQCWDLIIPAVQAHAQTNGNPTLTIATSTQFSQAVIDDPVNNIRDLASTTAAEVTASQQALAQIEQLIVDVTNNSSSAAQQQALLQLDQMVANNQLHSQQDAQNAADQRGSIDGALNTLLDNTRTTWADSQDANIGWCNVNNSAVVERWFNEWR